MASRELDGKRPVRAGAITIDAPGLTGELVAGRGRGPVSRGPDEDFPPALRKALTGRVRHEYQARILAPGEADTKGGGAPAGGRARRARQPMKVTAPGQANRQTILLARDENGVTTWHIPEPPKTARARAATGDVTFTVSRYEAAEGDDRFGMPPQILQVLSFPLVKAGGALIDFGIGTWDRRNHPSRLTMYGPDASQRPITDQDWTNLAAGPCLLFIHGTFDTIGGAFAMLPPATLRKLHQSYGGRVIAFDHPTLADSPIANARALLEKVGAHSLQVDVVCHSRGGLVTRSLAERPGGLDQLAPNFSVRTGVLVGATTNGTDLANVDHFKVLLDRLTTMLSFLPVEAAAPALATIVQVVKALGALGLEAAHDLDGLDAMSPGRPFLTQLNASPKLGKDGSYRAIASNYEPDNPTLKAFLIDEVKDLGVFKGPNDGMVADSSILGEALPNPVFPITKSFTFGDTDRVEHANYFGQPATSLRFLEWLTG